MTANRQADGFERILGCGRGRRPTIPTSQINRIIQELFAGQETIVVEQTINRSNVSEHNRSRLKEALGKRRFQDQASQISIVARLTGILPRVDSQGLTFLKDHQMHRWPGHWHSQESLLMADPRLKSATNCGLAIQGGDKNWQPIDVDDWDNRASRRCRQCATVSYITDTYKDRYQEMQTTLARVLAEKAWPEADDLLALRRDPWPVIINRVIHPLDAEEIDTSREESIAAAWPQLVSEALAQRPLSNEAVSARALDFLSDNR